MNESHNPWQIIDKHEIYSNNWISLVHHNVINPSGGKGIYGKLHFKNTAVGVVPMDEYGNIYLVGQYRFALEAYSWEIPEGGGDLNQDPVLAAQRELLEETGLVASQWQKLMEMHLSNSVSDEKAVVFLATGLSQRTATPEETELLVIKKLPFTDAYSMVNAGVITDAISVAAILKIRLMMLEGDLK